MRMQMGGTGTMETSTDALEELGSFSAETENGEVSKAKKFVKIQIYLPRKDAVSLEELRIRRMRKGQDVSRSRLICEAVYLLGQQESTSKNQNLG